ncbi:MAG: CHRD domain-containing protein [bacterium]
MKINTFFLAVLALSFMLVSCGKQASSPTAFDESTLDKVELAKSSGTSDANDFVAPLEGKQEVPKVNTTAHGLATFSLNAAETELSYKLYVSNMTTGRNVNFSFVTQAHIHLGGRGKNGDIVAFLFGPVAAGGTPAPSFTGNGLVAEGTLTSADLTGPLAGKTIADLAAEMRKNSENTYVNVHTLAHPAGEIRGQIRTADGTKRTSITAEVDLSAAPEDPGVAFVDKNGLTHIHDAVFRDRPVTGDITGTATVTATLHIDATGSGPMKGSAVITTAEGSWAGRFNGETIGLVDSGRFNLRGSGGLRGTRLKGFFQDAQATATDPNPNKFTLVGFIKH